MSPSTPAVRVMHHDPPRYSSYSQLQHRGRPQQGHDEVASSRFDASATTPPVTAPVSISRIHRAAPPPLPPPTFIPEITEGHDPGWQFANDPSSADYGRQASVKPGSSLLGGGPAFSRLHKGKERPSSSRHDHVASDAWRSSSNSTYTLARDSEFYRGDRTAYGDMDDSPSTRPPSNHRLHGERPLEQRTLEQSSNTYDKHLLSRIGGPNTPKRQSISYATGNAEIGHISLAEGERRLGQLNPLVMPDRWLSPSDSSASTHWPSSSPFSPVSTGRWPDHASAEISRPPLIHRSSLGYDDVPSNRGSYDQSMFVRDEIDEDHQMSNLNIHDRSPSGSDDQQMDNKAGTKRRASSPPYEGVREDRPAVSDVYQRRLLQQLPTRNPPSTRFHPSHSSVSSMSSYGHPQSSLGSSFGISSIPSSATSHGSDRLSPGMLSSMTDSEQRLDVRLGTARGPVSRQQQQHLYESNTHDPTHLVQRGSIEGHPRPRHDSISHLQGVYMCECCPKKPRKFNTEQDLRAHENEKQYICAYCPNRFKNKNEAERHQNSLHLRRHSWSCAALLGVEAAFHPSSPAKTADVCGYCGEEFPNPARWDIRAAHLNHVHKFGECNQQKKFFRADHFRQHLKHSHAGTSGKWTNMLENACVRDEPLPEERSTTTSQSPPGGS